MRISDWSSDVCSSYLHHPSGEADHLQVRRQGDAGRAGGDRVPVHRDDRRPAGGLNPIHFVLAVIARSARSEARRAGKACCRTCRYRWSRDNEKKNIKLRKKQRLLEKIKKDVKN